MSWFKSSGVRVQKIACYCVFVIAATFWYSCTSGKKPVGLPNTVYFPLQAYFQHEVDSLQRVHARIRKTVGLPPDMETREVSIKDWATELGAFLAADLSKPAYDGMFMPDSSATMLTYTALSPDIDIQYVRIRRDTDGRPDSIHIVRSTNNFLYHNTETLLYVPGQSYTITKEQQIQVMGHRHYRIYGQFLP